nr:MAG TPA: hypothetical protein [Caudoviricetes sp.]
MIFFTPSFLFHDIHPNSEITTIEIYIRSKYFFHNAGGCDSILSKSSFFIRHNAVAVHNNKVRSVGMRRYCNVPIFYKGTTIGGDCFFRGFCEDLFRRRRLSSFLLCDFLLHGLAVFCLFDWRMSDSESDIGNYTDKERDASFFAMRVWYFLCLPDCPKYEENDSHKKRRQNYKHKQVFHSIHSLQSTNQNNRQQSFFLPPTGGLFLCHFCGGASRAEC